MSLVQRPVEHETEDRAERLFQIQLPSKWVAEPYRKDYGVDFRVDVFENGTKTGISFGVQLKGTQRPLLVSKGFVRFPIQVRHLSDYCDNERQPIYLVVVDVTREHAYWLFLQRYAVQCLKRPSWREQQTVTIQIPITNTLTDHQRLLDDLCAADSFMCSMRPGSLPASYRIERERLKNLDPRFDAKLIGNRDQLSWNLEPREPVDLRLSFKVSNRNTRRKFNAHFLRGKSVVFEAHEFTIHGSPLFTGRPGQLELTKRKVQVEISVEIYSSTKGNEDTLICHVPGLLSGYQKELSIQIPFSGSPLNWAFGLRLRNNRIPASGKTSIEFDFDKWVNKDVALLPYFPQIAGLAKAIHTGHGLILQLSYSGNRFLRAQATNSQIRLLGDLAQFCLVVEKLKVIAERSGVRLLLPENLSDAEVEKVDELGTLLTDRVHRSVAPKARVEYTTLRDDAVRLGASLRQSNPTNLRIDKARDYEFGGHSFLLTPCVHVLTAVRLEDPDNFYATLNTMKPDDRIKVALVACETNELIIDATSASLLKAPISTQSVEVRV